MKCLENIFDILAFITFAINISKHVLLDRSRGGSSFGKEKTL